MGLIESVAVEVGFQSSGALLSVVEIALLGLASKEAYELGKKALGNSDE